MVYEYRLYNTAYTRPVKAHMSLFQEAWCVAWLSTDDIDMDPVALSTMHGLSTLDMTLLLNARWTHNKACTCGHVSLSMVCYLTGREASCGARFDHLDMLEDKPSVERMLRRLTVPQTYLCYARDVRKLKELKDLMMAMPLTMEWFRASLTEKQRGEILDA